MSHRSLYLIGLGVVVLILVVIITFNIKKTRDAPAAPTQQQFVRFSFAMSRRFAKDKLPSTLQEAVGTIKDNPDIVQSDFDWQMWSSGRDYWGNPLIYLLKPDAGTAIIRSYGPNGRDDGGKEDDIEVVIELVE